MEERAKRPGTLAHCLSFAGARRGLVVASLLLAALSAAASFVPFVAIYFVIADVVAAYPDLAALDAGALAGCGLLAIAGVAADVGLYLAALLCSHAAAFDTQYRLKLGIAEHLGRIPLGHIARLGSGRLSKIMDEGVSGIETFIAHSLPDLASTAAAPAVLLVLLFVFDWRFGLAAIAAVVVAMAAQFAGYANKRIMRTMGRYQEAKERMGNAAVEYVRGMAVVKAYGRTASSFARLADAVKDCTGLSLDVTLFFQNSLPAFTAILNNAYLFILPVGILLAPGASDWPAFALSFIFYLLFVPSVAAVFNKILYVSEDMMIAQSNIDRVDAVLDVPALPVPDAPDREQPRDSGIEFDHVSFSYRAQEADTGAAAGADAAEGGGAQGAPLALDDVSFRIPARTTCAIVGASGSGKSTIAHLIARFWDVDAGSVRIGGADVRRMAPDDLMAQMSLVFQDVHLFRESIAANIARPGGRHARGGGGRRARRPGRRLHPRAAAGLRHHDRRGGRPPLRRRAPAHLHRARHRGRRAHRGAGRGHGVLRPRERASHPAGARAAHARQDRRHDRAPPVHRGGRAADHRHGRRPRGAAGHARGAAGKRGPLPPHVVALHASGELADRQRGCRRSPCGWRDPEGGEAAWLTNRSSSARSG